MFAPHEIITTKSWQNICDYIYNVPDHPDIPPGGTVWCAMDQIPEFFKQIHGTGRSYILVSSHSDFGLWHQADNPVCNDAITTLRRILVSNDYRAIGYNTLQIPPSCNLQKCDINHKYSCRSYNITNATFPCIPPEVKHWFLVNNMIGDDSRLTSIPFGIQEGKENIFANLEPVDDNDKGLLYANFAPNTLERYELREYFKDRAWVTYKDKVPQEEFIDDLRHHCFCLCPNGNGVDSFRTLEALYCGCIPITLDNTLFKQLGLSIHVENFYCITPFWLQLLMDEHQNQILTYNARLPYWSNRIQDLKIQLL